MRATRIVRRRQLRNALGNLKQRMERDQLFFQKGLELGFQLSQPKNIPTVDGESVAGSSVDGVGLPTSGPDDSGPFDLTDLSGYGKGQITIPSSDAIPTEVSR